MSAAPTTSPLQARRRHRLRGRLGDLALHGITMAAALACLVLAGAIVWKILELSGDAFDAFGFGFITGRAWDPVKHVFGALPFIYGTVVSSLVALVMATPLAIAIGLYLSELAPRGVRGIVGSLVELLAAIPSVVLGLWGILVLGPFLADHVEPPLHGTLGFIPLFGAPQQTGQGLFTAAVILTIMIVPIVASICRELFLGVPRELEEGALALGATRWEMVRGVILPATRLGNRRGGDPRPRTRRRRGDRGDASDRRRHQDRLVTLSAGGHACEQDRLELSGRRLWPRDFFACSTWRRSCSCSA